MPFLCSLLTENLTDKRCQLSKKAIPLWFDVGVLFFLHAYVTSSVILTQYISATEAIFLFWQVSCYQQENKLKVIEEMRNNHTLDILAFV